MTIKADPIIDCRLNRYGTLFSAGPDVDARKSTPSVLFHWFCAALLMNARILHEVAVSAARASGKAGRITAALMAEGQRQHGVEMLNTQRYAQFDASTAHMLAETAGQLLDACHDDQHELGAISHTGVNLLPRARRRTPEAVERNGTDQRHEGKQKARS